MEMDSLNLFHWALIRFLSNAIRIIIRIWLEFEVTIDFDRFFPKRIEFDSKSRELIIENL